MRSNPMARFLRSSLGHSSWQNLLSHKAILPMMMKPLVCSLAKDCVETNHILHPQSSWRCTWCYHFVFSENHSWGSRFGNQRVNPWRTARFVEGDCNLLELLSWWQDVTMKQLAIIQPEPAKHLTSSSIKEMSAWRYSSILIWKASSSLRLTGTVHRLVFC